MATQAPVSLRREFKANSEARTPTAFETESQTLKTEEPEEQIALAPDHEAIARLAYGFWLDREHSGEGSAEEDWLKAEQELRNR